MTRTANRTRLIGIAVSTALATTALTGCTTGGGSRADVSASRAESALAAGKTDKAIKNAEAAVLADPRNAAYRSTLGNAYLNAGRFKSAATTLDDAMSLGDASPRTALSLALAYVGAGNQRQAVAVLNDWRDEIDPADLGLAYALAGAPDRGVNVLSDVLRSGQNTPKVRQNLAYSYALAGKWREARLMAAQDVPAGEIDQRISDWAQSIGGAGSAYRVSTLLGVPVTGDDPGQPAELALNNTPSAQQLAAEAAALVPARTAAADTELPALPAQDEDAPAAAPAVALARYDAPSPERPQSFEAAFATSAPKGPTPAALIADTVRFFSQPVVQKMPARYGIAPAQPARAGAAGSTGGSHLVQLGSFYSEQGARRAWGIYTSRNPALDGHEMKISQAVVGGKRYWRVSAAGFDKAEARSLCANVTSKGHGCIPYAADRPLPGAVES